MSRRTIQIPLSDEIDASTAEGLKVLEKDLGAMGVRLTIPDVLPGGTLVFEYDDEAHKRNAGRRRKAIPADSELSEMTQAQMDEWLLVPPSPKSKKRSAWDEQPPIAAQGRPDPEWFTQWFPSRT